MLLTRKGQSGQRSPNRFTSSLSESLSRALPTMDRRTFLKRSGIGIGAGIAASQLNLIQKARAADGNKAAGGKIEVKRTVCTHCSVGCAVDAVVENGVWGRQEIFTAFSSASAPVVKKAVFTGPLIGTSLFRRSASVTAFSYGTIWKAVCVNCLS